MGVANIGMPEQQPQPQKQPAAVNPQIAQPVKLDSLPEEERKKYDKIVGDVNKSSDTPVVTPTEEELKQEAKEIDASVDGVRFCQRCGWDTLSELPFEVEEGDKEQFLRCVLGSMPFEKKYNLFNGAVTLVFKARTTDISDALFKQLDVERDKEIINTGDAYLYKMGAYQAATTLMNIDMGDGVSKAYMDPTQSIPAEVSKEDAKHTFVYWAYKDRFENMPEPMFNTIIRTSKMFESLVDILAARAYDKDFWEGVGQS